MNIFLFHPRFQKIFYCVTYSGDDLTVANPKNNTSHDSVYTVHAYYWQMLIQIGYRNFVYT
jgi:hypothetical protein